MDEESRRDAYEVGVGRAQATQELGDWVENAGARKEAEGQWGGAARKRRGQKGHSMLLSWKTGPKG